MQTVKIEYERHQKEHKVIDQFQGNVEKCREAEVNQVFCIYIIYVFSLSLSLTNLLFLPLKIDIVAG